LDFLKEDGDGDRNSMLRWGLVGVCAVACAAVLFFVLRGSANAEPDIVANAAQDGGPPKPNLTPAASAKLVSMPQMADHRPDYWIQQWNSGADLISNAGINSANWTKAAPMARGSADMKMNIPLNSPVRLQNVAITLVTLANGDKRAVGKADIVNGTKNNVIDYRVELVGRTEISQ